MNFLLFYTSVWYIARNMFNESKVLLYLLYSKEYICNATITNSSRGLKSTLLCLVHLKPTTSKMSIYIMTVPSWKCYYIVHVEFESSKTNQLNWYLPCQIMFTSIFYSIVYLVMHGPRRQFEYEWSLSTAYRYNLASGIMFFSSHPAWE